MSSRYKTVTIDGVVYSEHRVIWEKANGPIPDGLHIDHINGDTQDNRLENLRLATVNENHWNSATPYTNTSGLKGLGWHERDQAWRCSIMADGKLKTKQTRCKLEAVAWIYRERKRLHGTFARFE